MGLRPTTNKEAGLKPAATAWQFTAYSKRIVNHLWEDSHSAAHTALRYESRAVWRATVSGLSPLARVSLSSSSILMRGSRSLPLISAGAPPSRVRRLRSLAAPPLLPSVNTTSYGLVNVGRISLASPRQNADSLREASLPELLFRPVRVTMIDFDGIYMRPGSSCVRHESSRIPDSGANLQEAFGPSLLHYKSPDRGTVGRVGHATHGPVSAPPLWSRLWECVRSYRP